MVEKVFLGDIYLTVFLSIEFGTHYTNFLFYNLLFKLNFLFIIFKEINFLAAKKEQICNQK